MPRNTRNFWVTAQIDGRTTLEGGPKAADGGFNLLVKMRDNGSIIDAARMWGTVNDDGAITLTVEVMGEPEYATVVTHR